MPKTNGKNLLGRRLQAAADFVRAGDRVADVGCDHGKLSAALLLRGIASFVVATDLHAQPLEKTRTLLRQLGLLDRARLIQTDGLCGAMPDEVDTVIIAGVGADTVAHIICEAAWLRDPEKRLILVPSSHPERVRRWLCEQGFEIMTETAVSEAGHLYAVMSAKYTGQAVCVDAVFAALGKISGGDRDAYVAAVCRKYKRILVARGEEPEARAVVDFIERNSPGDGTRRTDRGDH